MSTILLFTNTLQYFFMLFSCVPTVFPFIVGILHYARLNRQQKYMMWLSFCTFIVGVWSVILWLYKQNNLFIGHFYTVIQFILIVKIYQSNFQGKAKRGLSILIYLFIILAVYNTLYLQPLAVHNSNITTLRSVCLLLLILAFFFKAITAPKVYRLEKIPLFWFSSGALIYFFCSIFIFAISNSILPAKFIPISIPLWVLHNIFMWIFFILATIAVWISPKPLK